MAIISKESPKSSYDSIKTINLGKAKRNKLYQSNRGMIWHINAGERKLTSTGKDRGFIQPHSANIQNIDQDSGNESQPTTRNKEHKFRIEAWKWHNLAKKTTRSIMNSNQSNWNKWKQTCFQIEFLTNLRWIQRSKPDITLEIKQTTAKLHESVKN